MEEQQEQNIHAEQNQEQPEAVEVNLSEIIPTKKKIIPTCLGSFIILLTAMIVGAGVWWYANSYAPPETVDVSEMITQIKEKREAEKELPEEYDIEAGEVYYRGVLIEEVDLKTFEYIGGSYTKDKDHVYKYDEIVEGVDSTNCTRDDLEGCKALIEFLVYVNPVHGYSFSYTEDMQLVVSGHIPSELAYRGIASMEDLGLSDGDSLLIVSPEGGDNVVYTILELSSRSGYTTFEEYTDAMFKNLDESKIIYTTSEAVIGEDLVSIETFFKTEVETGGIARMGMFYDNVFKAGGKVYSISFGYPKDAENAEEFLVKYRTLLSLFQVEND